MKITINNDVSVIQVIVNLPGFKTNMIRCTVMKHDIKKDVAKAAYMTYCFQSLGAPSTATPLSMADDDQESRCDYKNQKNKN